MKRVAIHTVVFLLVGAVINVAVAWACALWSPANRYGGWATTETIKVKLRSDLRDAWLSQRLNLGQVWSQGSANRGFGVRIELIRVDETDLIAGMHRHDVRVVHIHRSGFPVPSMRCEGYLERRFTSAQGRLGLQVQQTWVGGIAAPSWLNALIVSPVTRFAPYAYPLPLHPEWPGFMVNTAVFGAGLAAVLLGPGVVRRRFRSIRGLCMRCSYPIGVSEVCTECGRPVASRQGSGGLNGAHSSP